MYIEHDEEWTSQALCACHTCVYSSYRATAAALTIIYIHVHRQRGGAEDPHFHCCNSGYVGLPISPPPHTLKCFRHLCNICYSYPVLVINVYCSHYYTPTYTKWYQYQLTWLSLAWHWAIRYSKKLIEPSSSSSIRHVLDAAASQETIALREPVHTVASLYRLSIDLDSRFCLCALDFEHNLVNVCHSTCCV